jgi:hypothetical protein
MAKAAGEPHDKRKGWRRLSSPSEDRDWATQPRDISQHGPTPFPVSEEQRAQWRCLSPLGDEKGHSSESKLPKMLSQFRSPVFAVVEVMSCSPVSSIIEIKSSPPMTCPPFSVIPCHIASEIQVPIRGSALALSRIPVVPPILCHKACCEPVLSEDAAPILDDHEIMEILKRTPCPSKHRLDAIALKDSDHRNAVKSFRVRHPGCRASLPSWVLTFWRSVATYWREIVSWKRAYEAVILLTFPEVLELLPTIPWDSRLPVPGASVSDLATFCTTDWLTDSHINLLAWYVNTKIGVRSVRFVQAAYPERIGHLFNAWRTKTTLPALTYQWLDTLRDQLRNGVFTTVGFCLNTIAGRGLPMPHEVGNHWIGIVINGQNQRIWFGDSMGHQPHASVTEMLDWWLKPAFPDCFEVHELPHKRQETTWSCGDRAVNMIAHHFDRTLFPLVGQTELEEKENRLSLFCNIIKSIRTIVCTFFHVNCCD